MDQQQKAPAHVPVRRPLRHPVLPAILAAIILTGLPAAATHAVAGWPVGYDVDLSSGFGDYRFGHFHFGIDIRTGGVTGKEVLAPVDGYVDVWTETAGGALVAYGSVVDNGTADPTTIMPE